MTENIKTRNAPPRSSAMVESLRGVGYSVSTALADIIDNSVSAQAKNIDIKFNWAAQDSQILIIDDGVGMSDSELEQAMQLGSKSPRDQRSASDLGRFGLGLKTASFSQGRSLTVASKSSNIVSCLRWDLDFLESSDNSDWPLLEGPSAQGKCVLESLASKTSGTAVLWEKVDRIVTDGFSEQDFLDLMDTVEQHLSMVFHRFISSSKIKIRLNNRAIEAWDPFLSDHLATWKSPIARIPSSSGTVEVQCFVLPHKDKLDQKTYDRAAGPEGWTAQQGFYVYRNERLLVAGSWLGLGQGRTWTKEESHRLARIKVDISNAADEAWKIDIKKSTARPSIDTKQRLLQLAEDTRDRARRTFLHRGQITRTHTQQSVQQAWLAIHSPDGGIQYKIDRTHPAVQMALENAEALKTPLDLMLKVIEDTVPIQRIWLDTSESKVIPKAQRTEAELEDIQKTIQYIFNNMRKKGLNSARAKEQLKQTEPFQSFPDLIDCLAES